MVSESSPAAADADTMGESRMFFRNFHPAQFLRSVYASEPFLNYCRQRNIALESGSPAVSAGEELRRWAAALALLPREQQVLVELELAKVNEMADRDAVAHLVKAAEGRELPTDQIASDAAVALWFFLHHHDIFHEVFLHQETQELDCWHNAQAPAGLELNYLDQKAAALAASLQEFFQEREGIGRYCAVTPCRLGESYCFVAHVSDRRHLLTGFADDGSFVSQRHWPALPVLFAYYPQDGTVLLRSHIRSSDWLLELFRRFGSVVLGVELDAGNLGHSFDLDLLKRRFDPPPDTDDMELVRVKALHLHYPERDGRRQVKLETLASDGQFAVLQLIQAHLTGAGLFDRLRVVYAELQVRLQVEGRSKNYVIRLWPNRSNLSQSPLGERFRACLKQWGVYHAQ